MLASSRLAVFPSGFHWGWRNIMTLALMWRLPILTHRLFLEPWFSMDRFILHWNDDGDWLKLGDALDQVSDAEPVRIATHNQSAFDALLSPEKVAEYFLGAALGHPTAL